MGIIRNHNMGIHRWASFATQISAYKRWHHWNG